MTVKGDFRYILEASRKILHASLGVRKCLAYRVIICIRIK